MPAHHTTVEAASFSPVDRVAPSSSTAVTRHPESALYPVGGQGGLDHRPRRVAHIGADQGIVVDEDDPRLNVGQQRRQPGR